MDVIECGEKVVVFIDLFGNLVFKKEIEDVLNEKVVSDMIRVKIMKSLFCIVIFYFSIKNILCIVINYIYEI